MLEHNQAIHIFSATGNSKTIDARNVSDACEEFCARAFEQSDGPWRLSSLNYLSNEDKLMASNHGIVLYHNLGLPAAHKEVFTKFDEGKLRYDLIPPSLLAAVAAGLTHGVEKYEADNWKKLPKDELWRYEGAAMRHFEAYRSGEYIDKPSGLPHLFLATTNLAFLIELTGQTDESDDNK